MKVRNLILIAAFFATLQPASAKLPLSGVTYTNHFIIRHDPDFKSTALVIGDACEEWLKEISTKLDYHEQSSGRIPVNLYYNLREFSEATGREKPGQVVGQASSRGVIDLDASGLFEPAEQIAGHEIVHVIIFRILGQKIGALPLWVNEGTAKYLTDDWDIVDRTSITNAISKGNLIPLQRLTHSFPGKGQEGLAYSESASAVNFFVKTYGEDALVKLIQNTGRTGSFETAMRQTTGKSVSEFASAWQSNVEGRFGSSRLIRLISIIGFLAMPVLALAAYLAVRKREKRLIEQYEQDEWEEANWRDWGGR